MPIESDTAATSLVIGRDHSSHVAQAIVNRLELHRQAVGDKVRYASALVDEELTVLEGAE